MLPVNLKLVRNMSIEAAFVVIENIKNEILLVRRKDFPIWDLPGGGKEQDESITDCAKREVIEETGLTIALSFRIGTYQRTRGIDTQHVFAGVVVGGKEIVSGDETSKLKWFRRNRLPILMVPHRRAQISDFKLGERDISCTLKDSAFMVNLHKLAYRIKRYPFRL